MRIAICYYGLVGSKNKKYGKGELLDPKICYEYYKKNIFQNEHKIDIFIHSQSIEFKKQLLRLYEPKLYKIEEQKKFFFKTILHKKIIYEFISFPLKCLIKKHKAHQLLTKFKNKFLRCLNLWSRWYSTQEVIDLKCEYEKKNKFKYDLVMLTRLDLAFLTKFDFDTISSNHLTVPNHNDVPSPRNNYNQNIKKNNLTYEKGISDFWFVSSSKNIDSFSRLYNHFWNYNISSHNSSYEHAKKMNLKLDFYKYRGIDHETIRRINNSEE